jgi:hypothetical protein
MFTFRQRGVPWRAGSRLGESIGPTPFPFRTQVGTTTSGLVEIPGLKLSWCHSSSPECARSLETTSLAIRCRASEVAIFSGTVLRLLSRAWMHLKTTNPVESTFATVRLDSKVTKRPGSRVAGLAMGHELIESAQTRWSAVAAQGVMAERSKPTRTRSPCRRTDFSCAELTESRW